MKCAYLIIAAVTVMALSGCRTVNVSSIHRGPIEVHPDLPYAKFVCTGLLCDQLVYVDDCDLEDASGTAITELVVDNGDRICFRNISDCKITLKYSTDLFARSDASFSLAKDECTNVTITSSATASYRIELICECGGARGDGSSNPTVRI